jgi:long-chain fatty acid transport protein
MEGIFKKIRGSLFIVFIVLSAPAIASDFNLPFVNAAELGDLYAGWAASGNDASTAYTNPAALTRIHNQQWVIAALGIFGTAEFNGTTTPPFPPFAPQTGRVPSKIHGFLPSMYFAAPVAKNIVFGFSVTTPFALGTNYSKTSVLRYAATQSSILANDYGPSIGFHITDQLSAGLGLDIDRLELTLNYLIGAPPFIPDFESQNRVVGWGYGMHAGLLYEFNCATRVGVNYSSQVAFHTSGDSNLYSRLLPGGRFSTNQQKLNMTLPAMAQLSVYRDLDPRWTVMGSVFYTDWSVFQTATLQNVIVPTGQTVSNTVLFNYRNTLDYAAGLSFKASKKWTLRTGIEYMDVPSNDRDRIVADPVGSAIILGVGAHYQQNCSLGYDIGFAHAFFHEVANNHVTPFDTEFGHCQTQTNVLGIQVTWNKPDAGRR